MICMYACVLAAYNVSSVHAVHFISLAYVRFLRYKKIPALKEECMYMRMYVHKKVKHSSSQSFILPKYPYSIKMKYKHWLSNR